MGSRDSQTGVSASTPPLETVFRREGQYWTIIFQGSVLRLRDTKGLRYIAHLLRHPGTRFPARQLVQEPRLGERTQFPGGENVESEPQVPDLLEDERARLGVTKRIKAAVRTIETQHPALGYHLGAAVKTGAYCVYSPDPSRPIVWLP